MYFFYSLLYTIAFLIMSPLFLLRRRKYAAGFQERLGNYPQFKNDARRVIWLHCVSVGETNAARPLVDQLLTNFPDHRLVFSTTTRTGQEIAQNIFKDRADAIFYFPFDWKFSVRRALNHFRPSVVLMMETEIWPRFFREAHVLGIKLAIVNGRLSERSFRRFAYIKTFIRNVLGFLDLALMQDEKSAGFITSLGTSVEKVRTTGNLKFDQTITPDENELTNIFYERFRITEAKPLIIAASTHEPEEQWIVESLDGELGHGARLLIAPRHPERFGDVAKVLNETNYKVVRRTDEPSDQDAVADIILLDSIGELRAAYPLAEIVFVGGSLIPHGGQSILEPAAMGKAVITGPYTMNFETVVTEFLESDAILQTSERSAEFRIPEQLREMFVMLLHDKQKRIELGKNAAKLMSDNDRNATAETINFLKPLLTVSK